MNKIILAVCFLIFLLNGIALATPNTIPFVGYVDEKRLFYNHPKWNEIEKKREQVKQAYRKKAEIFKENEADSNNVDVNFYVKLAQDQGRELDQIMLGITKEIHIATERVRIKKNISIVIRKDQVVTGGIDITDDVSDELKLMNK